MAKKTTKNASKKSESTNEAPSVNTAHAAQGAAAALMARAKGSTLNLNTSSTESASFKELKKSAAMPALPTNLPFGNITNAGKHGHQAAGFGQKQVGHAQTHSAANRTGVPRRTSGG